MSLPPAPPISTLSLNNRPKPGFVYNPPTTALAAAISSTRHVLNSQQSAPQAKGDLTLLLTAIQTTCKFIATNVRRARLLNLCVPACAQSHPR